MKSEQTFDYLEQAKCRICFEGDGNLISPCQCRGTVKYIHPECLKIWISKSLNNDTLNCKCLGDSKYTFSCELCKSQIHFQMTSQKGCKKCSQVKLQINQENGKFICLLVTVLLLSSIVFAVLYFSVNLIIDGASLGSIIFFIVFDIILLIIWIRFIYALVQKFFIGKVYLFGNFQIGIIQ